MCTIGPHLKSHHKHGNSSGLDRVSQLLLMAG
jgi:hypothetical protein